MTSPTPQAAALPGVVRQKANAPSRTLWFVGGCAVASLTMIGLLAVVMLVIMLSGNAATPAELARLVARPLVPEGVAEMSVSESEVLAKLSSRIAEASRLSQKRGELATVAGEYAESLKSLNAALAEVPSVQPLVRAGLDTWRSSHEGSDKDFFLGLLGVGSEVSKVSEYVDRVSAIHARIVACRIRVAEVASKQAQPESTLDLVTAAFTEARGMTTVADDTLALRNISNHPLTNVLVSVELTGRSGERFSNLFFSDSWEPNQVLLAICASAQPGRETVSDVAVVRFRVLSDEWTSPLLELRTNVEP